MKKRNMFTLVLIAVLALALGLGTMAYYKKTFTSKENPVRFADFTVNADGTLDEETEFDIPNPIAPGYANDAVYEFRIDKTGTEVPVEYDLKVTTGGEIFDNGPLVVTFYNKVDGDWVAMDGLTAPNFEPKKDVEEFKLGLEWPHRKDGTDINFEGMSGTIKIEVTATQVDPDEPATIVSLVNPAPITVAVGDTVIMPSTVVANMSDSTTKNVPVTWNPAEIDTTTVGIKTAIGTVEGYDGNVTFTVTVEEEPAPGEPQITARFLENAFLKNFGNVTVDVKNVEGAAKFIVTYKLSDGTTALDTEIVNIGEEAGLIYHNRQTNVNIKIYDSEGVLLHTFNNVVLLEE